MKNKPLISVVMSVFNSDKFLEETIISILNQTYKFFEFIIINDGSTDNSLEIIYKYKKIDKRIFLINRDNKGLVFSLNEGISIAKGRYIARMDADDIAIKERLHEQLKFMEENNLDICGSAIELFNNNGQILKRWHYPTTDEDIKYTLMCMCSFAHPSVMIRRSVFKGLKYSNYTHAEDYKLWTDIALKGYKMGNIDDVLLNYRTHDEQVSNIYNEAQVNLTQIISKEYRNKLRLNKEINFEIKFSDVSYIDMREQLKMIKNDSIKKSISNNIVLNIAHYILQHTSKPSILLYMAYFIEMKSYMHNYILELKIFIQSFFMLNRKFSIYQFLKRII
jgi:glycosyltransferase involved in cell wall biosynthesis